MHHVRILTFWLFYYVIVTASLLPHQASTLQSSLLPRGGTFSGMKPPKPPNVQAARGAIPRLKLPRVRLPLICTGNLQRYCEVLCRCLDTGELICDQFTDDQRRAFRLMTARPGKAIEALQRDARAQCPPLCQCKGPKKPAAPDMAEHIKTGVRLEENPGERPTWRLWVDEGMEIKGAGERRVGIVGGQMQRGPKDNR
jgi:hypothetical protein